MSNYAQCNKTKNSSGMHVIVNCIRVADAVDEGPGKSEADGIALLEDVCGSDYLYVKTSRNTHCGVHRDPDTDEDDSDVKTPLRKNYAGKGAWYDPVRDVFLPPKPYPSWTLNEDTCQWEPPTARPDYDKDYTWNEDTQTWDETL